MLRPFLIYLHGFRSSPLSHKAMVVEEAIGRTGFPIECWVPQLPHEPLDAVQLLAQRIEEELVLSRRIGLIGSSLGGFYAECLAKKFDLPAVLINPAVKPSELFINYLGENQNIYTKERFTLTETHLNQLRELEAHNQQRFSKLWVLLQTGDETLNYQEAIAHYGEALCEVEQGGTHQFDGFDRYVKEVIRFTTGLNIPG